jgi:hypothetical protein
LVFIFSFTPSLFPSVRPSLLPSSRYTGSLVGAAWHFWTRSSAKPRQPQVYMHVCVYVLCVCIVVRTLVCMHVTGCLYLRNLA